MKIPNFNQGALSVCLFVLFAPSASHAEIYKWVDANGQTHYSERKGDAGKAKTVDLKVAPQPVTSPAAKSPAEYWQDQERQLKQRQMQKPNEKPQGSSANAKPKSLSGGREDGTDASRCNLARDVISGAIKHRNGAPTDKYDREVAENDIRTFCR